MFDDLGFAEHLARGSSLCASEWPDVPMTGWATARDARNLVTGEITPHPTDDVAALLDRLHFAGNNGWFDGPTSTTPNGCSASCGTAAPDLDAKYVASYYQFGVGDDSAKSRGAPAPAGVWVPRTWSVMRSAHTRV